MGNVNARIHYDGSIGWLIFWIIVFFPFAFILLLTRGIFELNQTTYQIHYEGSVFWLCFWLVICFPIMFVLLFLNGFSIRVTTIDE